MDSQNKREGQKQTAGHERTDKQNDEEVTGTDVHVQTNTDRKLSRCRWSRQEEGETKMKRKVRQGKMD